MWWSPLPEQIADEVGKWLDDLGARRRNVLSLALLGLWALVLVLVGLWTENLVLCVVIFGFSVVIYAVLRLKAFFKD